MANYFKEVRVCECGYTTQLRPCWYRHIKTCKQLKDCDLGQQLATKDEQLAALQEQLAEQKEQMREQLAEQKEQMREQLAEQKEQMKEQVESLHEQLAAKDKQIEELIKVAKKPRTVNNTINNLTVDASVNSYGKESIDHITPAQIRRLLSNPSTAVPEFIRLKHKRDPGGVNANVRCPNKKQAIYQVVAERAGEGGDDEPVKQWEYRPKGDVLEDLYETNAGHLEAEADEDDYFGNRFLDHQDKVKASSEGEDGKKRYREQLEKIHCVITSS